MWKNQRWLRGSIVSRHLFLICMLSPASRSIGRRKMLFYSNQEDQGKQLSEPLSEWRRPRWKPGESCSEKTSRPCSMLRWLCPDMTMTTERLRDKGKRLQLGQRKGMLLCLLPTDTQGSQGALQVLEFWEIIPQARKNLFGVSVGTDCWEAMLATWKDNPFCRTTIPMELNEPSWSPKM